MPKKCIICGAEAKYAIKGTSDYYCEECADENFADISLLQKVEDKIKEEMQACPVDDEITEEDTPDSDNEQEPEQDIEDDSEEEPEDESEQEEE